MRVLVIDDDHLVRRGVVRVLGKRWDVVSVSSIDDALTMLGDPKARFDAIVCDLELGTPKNVVDLVKNAPDHAKNRVILYSGKPIGMADEVMAVVKGRFVQKTGSPTALITAIEDLVDEEGLF